MRRGRGVTTPRQMLLVLSEFARTMVTDFPIQAILDRLVERIVDVLAVDAAGVVLISPNQHPRYVAASNEAAWRFEMLQSELNQGPCVDAYRTGQAVAVPDLQAAHRFDRFTPQAIDAGLAGVYAFPLRHGDIQLGALDLYMNEPRLLDQTTMEAAQTLADVAAAYLLNAEARDNLRRTAEQSLERSLHDPLTGLANRALIYEHVAHLLHQSRRGGSAVAVLFLDLDRFKQVNDRFGHRVGDMLLVETARRLTDAVRPGDMVGRLSGDEFIIACNDVAALQTEALVARIHARLARPFALPGIQISVTATIGVACTSDHRVPPDRLIHDADLSMYRAKRTNEASHWLGKDGWLGRDGELVPNDDGDQPTAGDRGRSDSEGEREGPPG